MSTRFPPNIGLEAASPLLYSPYQQAFLKARRARFAACCQVIGYCGNDGLFRCPKCGKKDLTAKRVFRYLGCFAGRRGGKSVVGAHGAREEMLVPNSLGWVMGPTYKILHDATMPTLLKLIPRDWCADWSAEDETLTLKNGAQVAFRSLDDPDRAHCGVGPDWGWMDEAAFINPLAWDYFRPALTDKAGACFFTSSVDGFDWTYEYIEKPALVEKKPGYFAAKWRTIDNPFMATYRADEIADARDTMSPQMFRQEYEGERETFTGSVYGEWINNAWLESDDAVRRYIPEWPLLDPSRQALNGLDSGADHPFGGVKHIVTPAGIIAVGEYLERQRAFGTHLMALRGSNFMSQDRTMWAANRNEAQLRLEFAAQGINVAPAENDQMAGIQRVLSWLYTGRYKVAYTCPKLFDQLKKYRYAQNTQPDGQKSIKEKVFKLADELPDCVRYALMTWPSLPAAPEQLIGRDVTMLDPQTRYEIAKMAAFHKHDTVGVELQPTDKEYPTGDFYSSYRDLSDGLFDESY